VDRLVPNPMAAAPTQRVEDNAFHLPPSAFHALDDPDDRDDRDYPWGKECNRDANHAYTPHDCAGALRQGGERTALVQTMFPWL
jgi:hypothetical protein